MTPPWLTALDGDARRETAFRLHLLGLTGAQPEVMPGYLRAEEQLRRAARVKLPRIPAWLSVAEALASAEVDRADWPWFERRLALGEGREAAGLAAAAVALMPDWRPARVDGRAPDQSGMVLVTTPALRPLPSFGRVGDRPALMAGPAIAPELLLLGASALGLEPALRRAFAGLPPATLGFGVLMAAGTAFLALAPHDALLEAVLEVCVRDLLPPQHRADEVHDHIRQLAPRLDQPPGEIDRTMHGLGRKRADRLHRAWLRGFFVPRDFPLERPERAALHDLAESP